MAKALMVGSGTQATGIATGSEMNLFGYLNTTLVEADIQASATEACTFSKLAFNVASGGDLVNNLQFRTGGANGNQLATGSSTGIKEDAVNTDVMAAAGLFNLAYTDTGTNSVISWSKANVEFTSGYGAFTGAAAAARVFDIASATQFIPLSGVLFTDGTTTEANVAFKVRGYTTFEALQVRVTANARTNTSTFKNRINNADGTGSCAFAAAATGLVTSTGLGDAIADGNTICASITLGTGVEDLTVSFVVATLKSTDIEQDIWVSSSSNTGTDGGVDRAASATATYWSIGGGRTILGAQTEAQSAIKIGFAGTAKNLRCYLSANTYNGTGATAGTLKLMKNGVAVITTTITAAGGAAWYENTTDSITFTDTDTLSYEFDEGNAGSITIQMVGVTLKPDVPSTANASFLLLMI